MSSAKYGKTVRVPGEIYERVTAAAHECGMPVGAFINEALEDVLKGYQAKAAIRPRCIAKAEAHGSDPVVSRAKSKPSGVGMGKRRLTPETQTVRKTS